jgi:hypothetical protein
MTTDVVVVPSALALLPEYAGEVDPVADIRAASVDAVLWLVDRHPERLAVLTAETRPDNVARGVVQPPGVRVGRHLLSGYAGDVDVVVVPRDVVPARAVAGGFVVVANGTATRGEKAPGHLDKRSFAFDAAIDTALRSGDSAALRKLDAAVGVELWAHDVPALQALGSAVDVVLEASVTYAGDPYGVQYWVARWTCES